jgi:hypothetical protein
VAGGSVFRSYRVAQPLRHRDLVRKAMNCGVHQSARDAGKAPSFEGPPSLAHALPVSPCRSGWAAGAHHREGPEGRSM